jgi:hypothetical protein
VLQTRRRDVQLKTGRFAFDHSDADCILPALPARRYGRQPSQGPGVHMHTPKAFAGIGGCHTRSRRVATKRARCFRPLSAHMSSCSSEPRLPRERKGILLPMLRP